MVFCVSFVSAVTLNVVPFTLGVQGNAIAQWITSDKKSGTYSVDLNTTPSAGDYSYLTFAPMVSTIDDIASLSFYYKHVSNNGWAGPRIGIMINYSGTYYLIVSGAASNTTNWSKADGISGENLTTNDPSNPNKVWWYGTCNPNGTNYNQTGGPINFSEIKNNLNGDIMHFSIYMGVVNNTNVSNGEAYIDDIEINGITYYGKIQDAIDTAISDDTIHVNDGTYNENITVNKPLRIAGSGYSQTSIINCSGNGTGMLINSSNVIVSGFKIINCKNGIHIHGTTNTIINNSFNFNINGINISKALNNKINFNIIEGNTEFGINNVDNDIVNATFNWWGACDGPSGHGTGHGDNVSKNVNYSPWLGICIVNKSDANCTFETDNVTLKADLIGIGAKNALISYTINRTNHNKTALIIGNKVQATILAAELVGGMNVTWNVYVNDSTGRLYNNSWKTFYVRNITKLIVDPESPNGKNGWYITEPLFTLTKDNNGTKIYYQWDSKPSGPILYTGPFGLENIPNLPEETAGILELNWWTEFACGNETKQDYTFYIDLTDPLIKNLEPANNSIVYNNFRPQISAYLDEVYGSNSGINKSNIIIKVDDIDVIAYANISDTDTLDAIINYTPTSDLFVGLHNVTINVTDNAGRNSELTWFFGIGEAPVFTMNVSSPQDGIYGTRIIPFNISLNTTVKILEYINYNDTRIRWGKLCKDCNEYGNNSRRTKILNEGNNTITIRATDSFGNVKEKNISLFIDSRPPRIIKTLPRRNEVTNGTGFYIKYTEDNPKKIELFWNGNKTLNCTPGINQECRIDVNLSDHDGKFIDYYFNVSDLVRTVKSKLTRVKVDTTPPVLNIIMPKDGETYGRSVPFNITVSEDVLLEYYNKSDSRPTTLCNNCDDYGNSTKKTKSFRKGSYNLLIRATDKAGQSDINEIIINVV